MIRVGDFLLFTFDELVAEDSENQIRGLEVVQDLVVNVLVGMGLFVVEHWSLCLLLNLISPEHTQVASIKPQRVFHKDILIVVRDLRTSNYNVEVKWLANEVFGLTVLLFVDFFREVAFTLFIGWDEIHLKLSTLMVFTYNCKIGWVV